MTKKAQSTLEYGLIIACLTAGLLSMSVYIKRAFSGRLHEAADSMGQQYEPGNTISNITTLVSMDTSSKFEQKLSDGTAEIRNYTDPNTGFIKQYFVDSTTEDTYEVSQRYGVEEVGPLGKSLFGGKGGGVSHGGPVIIGK